MGYPNKRESTGFTPKDVCNVLIIYIYYLFYYYYVSGCILVKYAISVSGDHVRLRFGELGLLGRCLNP